MKQYHSYRRLPSINMLRQMMYIIDALPASLASTILRWMKWYAFEECEPSIEQITSDSRLEDAWYVIKMNLDQQFEKWAAYLDRKG